MNFDCNELHKVIANTQNINYNPLKEIKVTSEFYNYVIAKFQTEITLEDVLPGLTAKFTGIPIVIDDTIDEDYELIF